MKDLIFSHFKTISNLFLAMALSIVLLMIRMKLTHSFFYIFLVWNLFLAFIPFVLSLYLTNQSKLNTFKLLLLSGIWLLFLPNAPYMITDLIHLRLSETYMVWFDILVVVSFALCSMMCYLYSIRYMKSILSEHFNPKCVKLFFSVLPFAIAFGVYLGRFMRYNSWDLVHMPFKILLDFIECFISPIDHFDFWLFSTGFASLLFLTHEIVERSFK